MNAVRMEALVDSFRLQLPLFLGMYANWILQNFDIFLQSILSDIETAR